MKKLQLIFLFVFCQVLVNAQTGNLRKEAVNVFYDCTYCDIEYIKTNLTFVNYVRDSKEAQVHILVAAESTGSNGTKYTFYFIGQKEFEGKSDTLFYDAKADATSEELRAGQLQVVKLGLIPYVSKSRLASKIKIEFKSDKKEEVVEDKWKSWIFEANLSGWFNGEEAYKSMNMWSSLDICKVTPDIKIEFDTDFSFYQSLYVIDDEEVVDSRTSKSFEHLLVKSINDHWSLGYEVNVFASEYSNLNMRAQINPAIEYNVFPYSESTRKQFRLLYNIGPEYSNYIDTTLYDKTSELLYKHRLTMAVEFKEKWGSVSASVRGSNYLHDFSYNRLDLRTSMRLRLIKGLSFRVSGGVSLVHDQLSLPSGGASSEDILLRRTQLASQYDYWGSIGLSFTFGSIYNNVVNPRFGN